MASASAMCSILLCGLCACSVLVQSQEPPAPHLTPGYERKPMAPAAETDRLAKAAPPQTVPLTVAKGSPLQIALDDEVQVKKVGQPIHGRTVEPIYAFDHVVVPVGSKVTGKISKINGLSNGKRTLAALNADFTPVRKVEVAFDALTLPGGKVFSLHTHVTPGSGQVIQLVTAANPKEKKNAVKDAASAKVSQAKQQAHQQWDNAMKQVKAPGKIRRLERYGESQSPVHRQFIPAGTVYFAELDEPLDFGNELMTVSMASSMAGDLSEGHVVHALLITPLSSATARRGEKVEAVLSQPLMDGANLILPEGSRLKGTVKQAAPARRMKKNGQLRIAFSEIIPPAGVEQKVVTTLEGVQAGKNANVKLDAEGGAEATTSKSRYLGTAISLGLAMASGHGDNDHSAVAGKGSGGNGVAGGLGGFKLVGMVVGALVRSRAFGTSMGAYGAAVSVYTNFMARGLEVEFPKNTAMQIGIGTRGSTKPVAPAEGPPAASSPSPALDNSLPMLQAAAR
jgi:hypothetical protein